MVVVSGGAGHAAGASTGGELQMRIRRAYRSEDSAASIAAHDEVRLNADERGDAPEAHASSGAGELVKSLVFGGLDGIVTTFAIVAAVAGAGLSTKTVILMGVANLVADGISMGLGDFVSEQAERNFIRHEFEREQWELRNYPEGEFREMVDIYVRRKGFSEADAEAMMRILMRYPRAFVELMCVDELGFIAPPPLKGSSSSSSSSSSQAVVARGDAENDDDDEVPPWKKGLVTMLAFDAFGAVPIAVYIIAQVAADDPAKNVLFGLAGAATACTLFALGVTKATFTRQSKLASGATMLMNGSCAAAAAYGIGALLETILRASASCAR